MNLGSDLANNFLLEHSYRYLTFFESSFSKSNLTIQLYLTVQSIFRRLSFSVFKRICDLIPETLLSTSSSWDYIRINAGNLQNILRSGIVMDSNGKPLKPFSCVLLFMDS